MAAVVDGIPSLADALAGGSVPTPAKGRRVSPLRMEQDDDALPKAAHIRRGKLSFGNEAMPSAPPKKDDEVEEVVRELASLGPPSVSSAPAPTLNPGKVADMPKGIYDRKKRGRRSGKTAPPPSDGARAAAAHGHGRGKGPADGVRFAVDDAGVVSLTTSAGAVVFLPDEAVKRLEAFLEGTKALRK